MAKIKKLEEYRGSGNSAAHRSRSGQRVPPKQKIQLERGEIKFALNGEKFRGSFVIVKLKNSEKGNELLMIKHKEAAGGS